MPQKPAGTLLFVLHTHLPYVLFHGRWPHGTDWLCEAAAESYIPLLDELTRLHKKGIKPNITIGITPVLAEQLAHPAFIHEFITYIQEKIDASYVDEEYFRTQGDEELVALTSYWRQWYAAVYDRFTNVYNQDILAGFKQLQDDGAIEIITSCATHGYIPLLGFDTTIQAQVKQGVQTYKKHFGRGPTAFWLPECAYRPRYCWSYPAQPAQGQTLEPYVRKGTEEYLADNGLKCFFVENHLLLGGVPSVSAYSERHGGSQSSTDGVGKGPGSRGPLYQPHWVATEEPSLPKVAVLARDDQTGTQVWSSWQGYPGDPHYLDFHKKRLPGGHRYWRVTGPSIDMGDKLQYSPDTAQQRLQEHAVHFVEAVRGVLREHLDKTDQRGVICAPYDTELFGHWWFEGVSWLGQVLELLNGDPQIETSTVTEYLEANPPDDTVRLPEGSWGEGGFHSVWLNEQTYWSWELVYEAEQRMSYLARNYSAKPELLSLLKQLARELFLLTSSDWQFNISTGTSRDYGQMRLKEHYRSFNKLADMVEKKARGEDPSHEEWCFLGYLEERDDLFAEIDPAWFAALDYPVQENAAASIATV